jgi:teichuronic acid exporter
VENKYTKSIVIASLFWKMMERCGTQGIQFIVQIILARLLLPEDFGIIAIVTVFISLANVFVQSGFNTALIQKKNADEIDFSSVLYLSLSLAAVLYLLIFGASNYLAEFFQEPQITLVLKVLSITLFIGAFNSIQNAYVAKNMMFKKLFFSSLGSVIVSGTIGIFAAFLGLGVWALVIQQLIGQLMVTIILWFTVRWRPHLLFSFKRVRVLFSFGWKLLVSNLIHILYMDIRTLVIGKIYDSSMLGFYNRGENFPKIIVNNIDGSIQSVMFPTFSAHQDNKQRLKDMIRRTIVTSSFLIFPAMIGLAVVAEPLVKILLTEKWLPAVPFLQIFCISYAILPVQTINLQAISAIGRSDITLKLQIIKKTFGLVVLVISIPFGVYAIAIGAVISAFFSMIVNIYPNKKLLAYSYYEQFKDVTPSLLLSLLMGAIVYTLNFMNLEACQILGLQIVAGVVIYIGLAKLFNIESLIYLISTIKNFKSKFYRRG